MRRVALPIRAALALRGSNPGKAVEALVLARPYELGAPLIPLYPVYLRGQGYVAMQQGASAAAEFQKILGHPGVVANELIGALSHLQLGHAYIMSGDAARAHTAYQDFLALWKDADPDILILKQAKVEYTKLQ